MALTVLDAGIVIAILDSSDAHHDGARAALAAARDAGDRFVVPASAYAEILVAPLREGPAAADAVEGFLDTLPGTVEPATRQIAYRAAELRAEHGGRLRLPDALVVGTAIVIGADRVLTTDSRWPTVDVTIEVVGHERRQRPSTSRG